MRLLWVAIAATGLLATACGGGGGTPSHEDDPLGTLSWQSMTATPDRAAEAAERVSSIASAGRANTAVPTLRTPAIIPPGQVAAALIPRVREARPLLLPAGIGSRWAIEATLEAVSDSEFRITYTRRVEPVATLSLSIAVANPLPGISSREYRAFRRDPGAFYQVMDPVDPDGARRLMWKEPGRWAPAGMPERASVPYYLTATGLTDDEFWSIADSLRDVTD